VLAENVLAELTRSGPLRPRLVSAAWPSLSTEAKLQVVTAIQGPDAGGSTPGWLLDLAQADPAAIVRYWAARGYSFRETQADWGNRDERGMPQTVPAAPSELARYERAKADPSELVRLCVDLPSELSVLDGGLADVPHLQRLLVIRSATGFWLYLFVDWLEEARDAGVPEPELYECLVEFLNRPETEAYGRGRTRGEDPFLDLKNDEALERLWESLQHYPAHSPIATMLAGWLPGSAGGAPISVETLAALPQQVIESVVGRYREGGVFKELFDLVLREPVRFTEGVQKAVKMHLSAPEMTTSPEAMEGDFWRSRTDRSEAAVSLLLDLRSRIESLATRLDEVEAGIRERRGLFR
jgi:hypothetical protein